MTASRRLLSSLRTRSLPTPFVVLVGAAAGFGLPLFLSLLRASPLHVLIFMQVVIVLVGLSALRLRHGRIDYLNPLTLILLTFPFLYSWQAVLLARASDPFSARIAPWLSADSALQVRAAALTLSGLFSLILGYFLTDLIPRRRRTTAQPRQGTPVRYQRLFAFAHRRTVLVVTGIFLFILLVITVGGPAALVNNLFNRTLLFAGKNYFAVGPLIAFSAAAGRLLADNRWPPRPATILLLAIPAGLTLITGNKGYLAIELLLALSIIHYRYFPLRPRLLLPLALVTVISFACYDTFFRNSLPRGVPFSQALDERGGYSGIVTGDFVSNSLFGHQALAIAIAKFPREQDFRGLGAYTPVLLAPIPRGLMPDKPLPTAAIYTTTFAPGFYRAGSTIPSTALGEMYIGFGATGIVLGCFVLGAVLCLAYRARLAGLRGVFFSALASAVILHYMRGEIYAVVVVALVILLPGIWSLEREQPVR